MIESEFENISLTFESYRFRNELRNELLLQDNDIEQPGSWEYEGKWYHSKFNLYIAILAYEVAEQFGILDVIGLIAVLSGQPYIPSRAKFKGAKTKGTSVASKYLSKIPGNSPVRLPSIVGKPKIIGHSDGRYFKFKSMNNEIIDLGYNCLNMKESIWNKASDIS